MKRGGPLKRNTPMPRGGPIRRDGRVYRLVVCEDCGAEVEKRVDKKAVNPDACASCAQARRRRRIEVECERCGGRFEAKRSEVERGKAKFCSWECSYAVSRIPRAKVEEHASQMSTERRGAENPAYKHGRYAGMDRPPRRWKLAAKGEERCRCCRRRRASHLHHIVPRSKTKHIERDDPSLNGMPLCAHCHHGWHHREVVITHDLMLDAEFAWVIQLVGSAWVERNYPNPELAKLLELDSVRRGEKLTSPEIPESIRERSLRLLDAEWLAEAPLPGRAIAGAA